MRRKHITTASILTLCAAAVYAVPALSRAQDNMTPAPVVRQTTPAKRHHSVLPFRGKLVSVNTNVMTFVVGKRTFKIISETTITKDGHPAVLADGVAGEPVRGSYKKAADGSLNAKTVRFGAKASKQKEETAADN